MLNTQVDRLLRTKDDVTLSSRQRAAAIVARRVRLQWCSSCYPLCLVITPSSYNPVDVFH